MTEPPTLRRFVVCMRFSNVISEYNTKGGGTGSNPDNRCQDSWVLLEMVDHVQRNTGRKPQ